MKTIKLSISGKIFNISLEDDFATSLEPEIEQYFSANKTNDPKSLLAAYIDKSHKYFELKQEIEEINNKLDKCQELLED